MAGIADSWNDFIDRYFDRAENPNFEEFDRQAKHVHDWRTYVSDEVRGLWTFMTLHTRCAIISCCQEMADNEEWE